MTPALPGHAETISELRWPPSEAPAVMVATKGDGVTGTQPKAEIGELRHMDPGLGVVLGEPSAVPGQAGAVPGPGREQL